MLVRPELASTKEATSAAVWSHFVGVRPSSGAIVVIGHGPPGRSHSRTRTASSAFVCGSVPWGLSLSPSQHLGRSGRPPEFGGSLNGPVYPMVGRAAIRTTWLIRFGDSTLPRTTPTPATNRDT